MNLKKHAKPGMYDGSLEAFKGVALGVGGGLIFWTIIIYTIWRLF